MATYVVNSLEDVFDLLFKEVSSGNILPSTIGEDFSIKIKLIGKQWDGKIDYRVAEFVQSLQDKVLDVLSDVYKEKFTRRDLAKDESLAVKITISEGSSVLEFIYSSLGMFKEGFETMESKHKAYTIVAALALGFSAYAGTSIYDSYVDKIKKISDNETQQMLFKTFENIQKNSVATPIQVLTRKMKADDLLDVGGQSYSRQEAIEAFKPMIKNDIKNITYNIDDKFEVLSLFFETSEVLLKINDRKFRATTKALSEDDRNKLHTEYQHADSNGYVPSLDLQVSVEINQGKIASKATIKGLGQKRPSAITLKKALESN